jgi:hypothetical protein
MALKESESSVSLCGLGSFFFAQTRIRLAVNARVANTRDRWRIPIFTGISRDFVRRILTLRWPTSFPIIRNRSGSEWQTVDSTRRLREMRGFL